MVTPEDKKTWAVELLRKKEKELGRLPQKNDFDEVTRSRIKAFLGPWPRALEAAGLKEEKKEQKKSKKRRKISIKSRSAVVPREAKATGTEAERLKTDKADDEEGGR